MKIQNFSTDEVIETYSQPKLLEIVEMSVLNSICSKIISKSGLVLDDDIMRHQS